MSTKGLVSQFEKAVAETGTILDTLPWHKREAYGAWLAQTYHLVKHTTRFVCLAAGSLPLEAREAHYDWIGHLKGELNHDLVAQKDLKAMGLKPEDYPETIEVQLLQQAQYFFLDRGNPMAINGYALLLEGLAAKIGPRVLEIIEPTHGKAATNFLRLHCTVDIEHFAEGLKALDHLKPSDSEAIEKNLAQAALLYQSMIKSIVATHGKMALPMPTAKQRTKAA